MSMAGRIWATVGVLALVAVAAWLGWGQASAPVRWQDVGFSVPTNTEATVTYDVFLYTDQPVTCYLQALNNSYGEVGVSTQQVDPANGREQRFTTTMSTVEEATTALVDYCAPR
jgi:hypothetical protein